MTSSSLKLPFPALAFSVLVSGFLALFQHREPAVESLKESLKKHCGEARVSQIDSAFQG